MFPGQRTIWQRALALVPLLLIVVALPNEVLVRCRMDGQLRSACCCPQGDGRAAASLQAIVRDSDCCSRVTTASDTVPSEPVRGVGSAVGVPALLGPSIVSATLPTLDHLARVQHSQRPAREGPRLILLKRSFLI